MKDETGEKCCVREARHLPKRPRLSANSPDAGHLQFGHHGALLRTSVPAIAFLMVLCSMGPAANACAIPVFRYALEHWQSDLFEADVFHRGPLSAADRTVVSALEDRSLVNGGSVNLEVVPCDVDGVLADDLQQVWSGLDDPPLPYLVVRAPGGRGGSPIVWKGLLADVPSTWGDSSVEREVQRRILAGDAIVWVVLTGEDAAVAEQLAKTIEDAFPALVENIPLPPGIGLPGSQLLSSIPLEIRFSVLTIARNEAADTWLRRSALAMSREAVADRETLVLPIFGRGRALASLKPTEVDADSLEELSRFLCGACSCQAKELNPGFDLLLSIHWDEQLFDPDATPIQEPDQQTEAAATREPEFVPIPAGNASSKITAITAAPSRPANDQPAPSNRAAPPQDPLLLWGSIVVVLAVYLWRRGRRNID